MAQRTHGTPWLFRAESCRALDESCLAGHTMRRGQLGTGLQGRAGRTPPRKIVQVGLHSPLFLQKGELVWHASRFPKVAPKPIPVLIVSC